MCVRRMASGGTGVTEGDPGMLSAGMLSEGILGPHHHAAVGLSSHDIC